LPILEGEVVDLCQLRLGAIIVGVGHQFDARGMTIALYHEGAIAALTSKMIGPACPVLVGHALLHNIAGRVGQGLQEVAARLGQVDDQRVRILHNDTRANNGFDFSRCAGGSPFDQAQKAQANPTLVVDGG